jgi:dolichol-phosphate mannosyltransferase
MSIMIDAITGFSNRPLRLIVKIGLVVFFLLILRWASIIYKVYFLGETPTDLTIVLNTILVAFSMIILFLGVIGDYVWRILDETRKRSVFVIDEVIDSAASNEEQLNTK